MSSSTRKKRRLEGDEDNIDYKSVFKSEDPIFRYKRAINGDKKVSVNPPMFVFQANHQRKFMANQNNLETKVNGMLDKFNNEISRLNLTINQLKEENVELNKNNKYLKNKVTDNELYVKDLRDEMTDVYIHLNKLEKDDPEQLMYIN